MRVGCILIPVPSAILRNGSWWDLLSRDPLASKTSTQRHEKHPLHQSNARPGDYRWESLPWPFISEGQKTVVMLSNFERKAGTQNGLGKHLAGGYGKLSEAINPKGLWQRALQEV